MPLQLKTLKEFSLIRLLISQRVVSTKHLIYRKVKGISISPNSFKNHRMGHFNDQLVMGNGALYIEMLIENYCHPSKNLTLRIS